MITHDPRDLLLRPIVSEKSYAAYDSNVYTFEVASGANKVAIRQAVEAVFHVRVARVNTINRPGKRKRNRKTGGWGKRPDRKRALVTLVGDDKIDIFGS